MSLNYLLDGYNIINLLPRLAQKELEDARNSLVSLIEIQRPHGSLNNQVTIVFDGQSGFYGQPQSSFVKIVFASGESADDYIKRTVASSSAKKSFVVVTNDKDIKFFVRALGAQVLSVESFMGKTRVPGNFSHGRSKAPRDAKEESKHISTTLEHRITSEFEDIWLKKPSQDKTSFSKKPKKGL